MDAQTILAILVGVALACFSLVMVGYSFFRNRNPQQEATSTTSVLDGDGIGLDSLFDSLDTLELEHQLGNIPDEQYAQQRLSYRQQIAAVDQGTTGKRRGSSRTAVGAGGAGASEQTA